MALDIILIVVGMIIVIVSFFISEKGNGSTGTEVVANQSNTIWSEKDERMIRDRVDKLMRRRAQDIVEDTEDKLGHLSNEKIMAVSEYSDQVLEKIDKNHSEVVFLYDMLNKKEEEMKELIHQIDVVKAKEQDSVMRQHMQNEEEVKEVRELQESVTIELIENDVMNDIASKDTVEYQEVSEDEAELEQLIQDGTENVTDDDKTTTILQMYQAGKNVREIGKELQLGVGEVMLVINMNQVKKG